jgi:hypothetical protein
VPIKVLLAVYAATLALSLFAVVLSVLGVDGYKERHDLIASIVTLVVGPFVMTSIFAVYAFPAGMAYIRQHRDSVPIMIVNLAFGWTFLGWIASLAWAFSSNVTQSDHTVRVIRVRPEPQLPVG